MKFCNALAHDIFNRLQRNLPHVTTVLVLQRVQNFVVINLPHIEPQHCDCFIEFRIRSKYR